MLQGFWGHIGKAGNRGLALAALMVLQACVDSGDGSETSPFADAPTDTPTATSDVSEIEVEIGGSVGDGPVVNALLEVIANDGSVLSDTISGEDAGYNIKLKTKGKYYPLTIDALGGTDLVTHSVPGFTMTSAATEPRRNIVANINTYTTLAIAAARQTSGGLSSTNISTAVAAVTRAFNAGMTSTLSVDPMTVEIDDSNLAEIVKASEVLAEIFRRTQAALGSQATSVDGVIEALGADLVDGALDGAGAAQTNRKISALTVLVSSQVMLEAMVNELEVNGQDVTTALDDVIRQLATGQSPALTASRPVTEAMIGLARRGVDAAIALADSPELQELSGALGAITEGMSAELARATLPTDESGALDASIQLLSTGSDADFDAVLSGDATSTSPISTNTAPVISGTPPTSVNVGETYSFVPTASDVDDDALAFSILGLPYWASFNPVTGALTGQPASADVGSYGPITLSVSDGFETASLPSFSITVNEVLAPEPAPAPEPTPSNTPPVISGTPSTSILQDNTYSFVPTASDDDGDTLTFSISGRPLWATFNPNTGELAGRPTAADIGTYTGITISVSDGAATASLPAFSITVQAIAVGSATLSWVPPTANTDGSALNDLAGYKIHWGDRSGSYSHSTTIMNPGISTYVVENLTTGTYYFAVTALNSSSMESTFSNEASMTIN